VRGTDGHSFLSLSRSQRNPREEWGFSGRACTPKLRGVSGQHPMTRAAKCPTFNTSFRRRNCTSFAGRFGGVAHVTPMRDIRTGVDKFIWWMIHRLSRRCGSGPFKRLTMGVTQLKVKEEKGAEAIVLPNLNVDDAAFRRTLPVRLAEKSRTPPRLIFSQNRLGQLASFPHPGPTRLRQ
jgi:hypothetical protein